MNNFIELNIKRKSTGCLMPLRASLSHSPDERLDIPSKLLSCLDCGINNTLVSIYNGYCRHCAEIHQYDNY